MKPYAVPANQNCWAVHMDGKVYFRDFDPLRNLTAHYVRCSRRNPYTGRYSEFTRKVTGARIIAQIDGIITAEQAKS